MYTDKAIAGKMYLTGQFICYTMENAQKAKVLSNIRQMMDQIQSLDYFSIARYSKYKYRKYLKDFYYFENPEQEKGLCPHFRW